MAITYNFEQKVLDYLFGINDDLMKLQFCNDKNSKQRRLELEEEKMSLSMQQKVNLNRADKIFKDEFLKSSLLSDNSSSNSNKITSNCGYCGSGITEYDRNCPRCGAPNKNNVKNDIIEVHGGNGNHLIYSYHSRLEELKQEHNSLEEVRLVRISQGLDFADISNEIRKIENEIGEIKETN